MCSVKETFEYTFDDVRMDARCWFDIMLIMEFLRCTLISYLLLMVLVMLMSKKFKDLFSFSYSMVYWIAGSCLFNQIRTCSKYENCFIKISCSAKNIFRTVTTYLKILYFTKILLPHITVSFPADHNRVP